MKWVRVYSIKDVNDMVWGDKWEGKFDPKALCERLQSLLFAEQTLADLQKKIDVMREIILR